jgi:hypothetical protein
VVVEVVEVVGAVVEVDYSSLFRSCCRR